MKAEISAPQQCAACLARTLPVLQEQGSITKSKELLFSPGSSLEVSGPYRL